MHEISAEYEERPTGISSTHQNLEWLKQALGVMKMEKLELQNIELQSFGSYLTKTGV